MALEEKVEDWPMLGRNPQHTAYYPKEIDPKKLKLKWKVKVEKPQMDWRPSSLVIINNIVYFYDHAFDTETGKELPLENKVSPYSVEVNDVIYSISEEGLSAINRITGERKWEFKAEFPSFVTEPPTVARDTVFVGVADNFYALDNNTGKEKWRFNIPKRWGKGTISSSLEDDLVFFPVQNKVYALNAQNGKREWLFEVKDKYGNPKKWYFPPPLAVADGVLYAGSVDGGVGDEIINYWLHALNAETGKERWVVKTRGWCGIAQPIVTKNAVIFGSNNLYVLDKEGRKIKKIRVKGYFDFTTNIDSIAISKNVIYVGFEGIDTFLCAFCEKS